MKERNNILNELNEISPLLKSLKEQEQTINCDNNFFNDIQNNVIHEIHNDKKIVPLWRTKLFIIKTAVAASVVIAIAFGIFHKNTNTNTLQITPENNQYAAFVQKNYTAPTVKNVINDIVSEHTDIIPIQENQALENLPEQDEMNEAINTFLTNNPTSVEDLINEDDTSIF